MMNVLGNPFEATIAATALVLGGVMDAFPKLEVYLPHAGGFFPFAIPRIAFAMSTGNFKNVKQPAAAYLRRFHYDLIMHSPALTRTLIDMVGVDRVVSVYGLSAGHGHQAAGRLCRGDSRHYPPRGGDDSLRENPSRLLKLKIAQPSTASEAVRQSPFAP